MIEICSERTPCSVNHLADKVIQYTMITSKQRAYLRRLANGIPSIFQIGKDGLSNTFIQQVADALEARELIKIHVLENSLLDVREVCGAVAKAVRAEPVQVIGSRFVLYKESRDKRTIELNKIR